jgi:hypothetical protein
MKYAFYFDPAGKAATEHEMYDLEDDPNEQVNLVDRLSGKAKSPRHQGDCRRLGEHLNELMEGCGTGPRWQG